MADSATIVAASLSDKELRDSVTKLVNYFDDQMKIMAVSTNITVDSIEKKLKSLGSIKIDSGGTADGGSSRRMKSLSEEIAKAKEVTMSYDQMQAALQKIAKDNGGLKDIRTFNKSELQSYIDLLRKLQAEYVRVNTQEGGGTKSDQIKRDMAELEKIIQGYQTILRNVEAINSRQGTIDVRKWTQDIGAVDDRYKKLVRWYTVLEKEDQRRIANEEKANQKRLAELDKEEKARQKMIESARKAEEKYQNAVLKTAFNKIIDMPSNNIDQMRSKLERLQTILANIRELGILSPKDISNAETEIGKLRGNIQQIEKIERERIAAERQFVVEQAKEIEQTQTLEGRIRSLTQIAKERLKEEGRFTDITAYGKNLRIYDPSSPFAKGLSIEQQIKNALTEEKAAREGVSQTAQQQLRTEREITNELEKRKKYEKPTTTDDYQQILRNAVANKLGIDTSKVINADAQYDSIKRVGNALKQLQDAYSRMSNEERNSPIGKQMIRQMQELQRQSQQLRAQMSRPINLKDALGGSEKTLDDIAYKMRQLASYKMGLNITDPKAMEEMRQVDTAINRLKKQYDDLMGKNQSMIASNNALGRSWNYMKNRLAFYFTVGASTQFIKNLIDIRGQYELLERSIGILIDSAQNGSQIFAELNSMAIKSPFTTMELGAAAKQLVAYDVAAKDVVDTTRRLADMAAAVGIPIERLTYALGQIKAYGYLNARDARMFANAGIPLVKELADRYTELEGRLVSTADVYDRIKKKAISYEDVMATVNKMTDEGGKFFNFQEKAADTLKVRIANLTLAWNNMMNEMGAANQGVLSSGLKTLSDVFKNWRSIYNLITSIIVTFGVLKATQVVVLTNMAMHIKKNITLWAALEFAMRKSIGAAVVNNLRSIGSLLARFSNPLSITAAVVTALGVAIGKAALDYRDLIAANEAFNKSISDNAKENIESIEKFFEDYKNQLSNIGGLNNADQEKLWERIQEEIEKTTKNAEDYIKVLNDVKDVSSRIRLGEDILEQSKTIQGELQRLADSGTFSIGGGFANDSAAKNLQNYQKALNEIRQEYGSVNAAIEAHTMKSRKLMADYTTQRNEVRAELNDFVSKLDNAYMPEILGQSDDVRIQMANVRSFAESLRDAFVATEEGSKIGADGIVLLNNAIDKWITKQGVANNLIVNANGDFDEQRARIEENKTAWEEFFRYISKKDKEYLDAAIKTNNISSEEVRKIWDKAAEEMSKRATTSYDLIQDQIAQLRNTPDIVINVVYRNEKQKLDKDQEEFEKRFILPEETGVWSTDKYIEKEKENREKYGTLMRKQGEDTVEYEKRISDERKTNLELQKKNGDIIEENKNKTDAYSQSVTEQARKEKKAADDRLKVIKEIEDASGYDFSTKSENAAARKAQKQAESELAKALKDELSTIDKVRSIYKELTKEGMSHADAVERATKGWDETTNAINRVLQKNGLQKLDLSKFAGVENPRELLNTLQSQLKELVKRGASTSEIRVLQTKIQTVSVEADKYDLTKITKGLNNELDRLKDEYELAVALDADPELGNMFADWMGIDVNDLPRTASEYAERASKILNNKLKDLGANVELPNVLNITDDDMRAFEENKTFTDKQLELVKKAVDTARSYQKKEVDDRIKDWDKLLEKYAEYETKVNKIHDDAVKERVTFVQQFAKNEEDKSLALQLQTQILAATDPQEKQRLIQQLQELVLRIAGDDKTKINLATAINNNEQQGIAKVDFEEYQKSPEWIAATGDLAGMTTKAIGYLISSLERYKKSAKNLDPKQIKQINSALRNLHRQQRQGNPFLQIADAIDRAKERADEFKPEMDAIMSDIIALEEEIGDNDPTEEQAKHLQSLKDRWKDLAAQGDVSATEYVNAINSSIAAASQAISMFTDMADALGGKHMTDATKTIKDVVSVLDKAGQGAALGAQIGGGWGALIGGVAGGLTGLITTFADQWSGNAAITEKVEESVRAVKRLEVAYVDLQQAVDRAYGTAAIGAKHATLANKELQLAELQRQIQLEKSRSSKNRDEDKIIELQKQYKELFYEIQNGYTEIVDDLMGTDVASFAENLVSSMIDAFKQGEDYMQVFSDKFDEMIDNMIMKSIVSRVVSQYLDQIWDSIDERINDRSKKESEDYANAQNKLASVRNMSDEELSQYMALERGGGDFHTTMKELSKITQGDIAEYRKAAELEEKAAKERLDAAAAFTGSDVDYIMGQITEIMPELGQKLKDILGEYYKYGESSETQLSALQQGIAGISEDTAGALEAYMNGVSQQVYLQSDLLTQIRDAVVGFDLDVQVATMSQILLQLQSSYTVQMSIQGILEGWNNPSGQAVRVELVS